MPRRNRRNTRRSMARGKRVTPTLVGRMKTYGTSLRTPKKPHVVTLNPVIPVTISMQPPLATATPITVGQIATAISNQGHTISSFTLSRIDVYGYTVPTTSVNSAPAVFQYVPLNRAWSIDSIDNVTAGTYSFIPPAFSSGPYSNAQSSQQLFVVTNVQSLIIRLSVVTVKPVVPIDPFLGEAIPILQTVDSLEIISSL